MPRYYFNVHRDASVTPDLVGREVDDDEAPRAEAHLLAKNFARSRLFTGSADERVRIEALDENQRPVVLLPLEDMPAEPSRSA